MKRCPECRRDYNDDSLSFCLDDGMELLFGPTTAKSEPPSSAGGQLDEPATVILHAVPLPTERAAPATETTAILPSVDTKPSSRKSFDKRLLLVPLLIALIVFGVFIGYRYFSSSNSKQIESIAVLPFVNESGNADVEYLSDGMAETLINNLSKLRNLSVKARNAVFRYKGKDISAKQIGDELGVQAVLLGTLAERAGSIRLNLELVNARTLDVIWSEQYDRKQGDLVTLQQEIARDVSNQLRMRLTGTDQENLAKRYTNDPEAYRLYLQGRFYLNKRVGKLFDRAGGYLQQAIERDPNFALGYAGLAEFVREPDRQTAKAYARRAVALDDQLSEAHVSLGYQYMLDYNWAECERSLKRAIELDPKNHQAFQLNGSRLLMLGRYDEAMASYDSAIAIEPTIVDIRNNRAAVLVASGKLDEAIALIKGAIEIDPSFAWTHSHLSYIYRIKGDHAASVAERVRAAELLDQPENARKLRETFAASGWSAYVRELLGQDWGVLGRSETRVASFLAELGEKEKAFDSLNAGAAGGDWWLFSIKYDPAFDAMRADSRFQDLLKKFDPASGQL
jgi:TolB-like protein